MKSFTTLATACIGSAVLVASRPAPPKAHAGPFGGIKTYGNPFHPQSLQVGSFVRSVEARGAPPRAPKFHAGPYERSIEAHGAPPRAPKFHAGPYERDVLDELEAREFDEELSKHIVAGYGTPRRTRFGPLVVSRSPMIDFDGPEAREFDEELDVRGFSSALGYVNDAAKGAFKGIAGKAGKRLGLSTVMGRDVDMEIFERDVDELETREFDDLDARDYGVDELD